MPLTEDQLERIKKNRERALEIQRRRREDQEQKAASSHGSADASNGSKRREEEDKEAPKAKRAKLDQKEKEGKDAPVEEVEDDLEAFEEGASDLVTKKEAKKMYCLPEGTLQVCAVVEKDNPHNRGWSKMKLYNRSEIRRRARKRFGGKEGLIAERTKREDERFRNDIEKTKDIFKK